MRCPGSNAEEYDACFGIPKQFFVTSSNALVTSTFQLLVVMPLLLVAMPLLLVVSSLLDPVRFAVHGLGDQWWGFNSWPVQLNETCGMIGQLHLQLFLARCHLRLEKPHAPVAKVMMPMNNPNCCPFGTLFLRTVELLQLQGILKIEHESQRPNMKSRRFDGCSSRVLNRQRPSTVGRAQTCQAGRSLRQCNNAVFQFVFWQGRGQQFGA